MKINEMRNLYEAYNLSEDFRMLICASDNGMAIKLATEYSKDSKMSGDFEIKPYDGEDKNFDCDYILAY